MTAVRQEVRELLYLQPLREPGGFYIFTFRRKNAPPTGHVFNDIIEPLDEEEDVNERSDEPKFVWIAIGPDGRALTIPDPAYPNVQIHRLFTTELDAQTVMQLLPASVLESAGGASVVRVVLGDVVEELEKRRRAGENVAYQDSLFR